MSDDLSTLKQEANILREKQFLINRKYDRQELTEAEFNNQSDLVRAEIKNINKKIIDIMNNEREMREKADIIKKVKQNEELRLYKEEMKLRRRNKMANEKVDKPVKVGVKKGLRKESNAAFILEALQKKSLNNLDKVVDNVIEKKPGVDRAKLKIQASNLIKQVKTGKRKGYTWNDEDFQLTQIV